jgi:ribosomal protein S27E
MSSLATHWSYGNARSTVGCLTCGGLIIKPLGGNRTTH